MIYITQIRMSSGGTKHEHITDLKWRDPAGGDGQSTTEAVVEWIRKNGDARVKDSRGEVHVRVVEVVPPHLRTVADGRFSDNLLSLPRF